jgi:hypothetical protein
MLDKAVAAVRADKLKALEMFNGREGGPGKIIGERGYGYDRLGDKR